jgi:tetratricopeptide (TPR) repeat protein
VARLLIETHVEGSENPVAKACRADALMERRFIAEALSEFEQSMALDKSILNKFGSSIGLTLSYSGRYAEAIDVFQKLLHSGQDDVSLHYNMAVAMCRWKGLSEAESYIKTAQSKLSAILRIKSMQGTALYGLGGLSALKDDKDQALTFLEQAISLEKKAVGWALKDRAWDEVRNESAFQLLIGQ